MKLMFSMSMMMGVVKMMNSSNFMSTLISLEMMMSSLLVLITMMFPVMGYSYILMVLICMMVCDGAIGLSIMISSMFNKNTIFKMKV
uniref:NADH dehydrogenase subunit 4L n=1 Tax=Docophoroides brevis TaxID=160119 RepID=UPI00211DDC72|nr:NADH dehydrogenase subunit 4L [Docophoroides brevis]UTT72590.1 NADH dehydrogenase subunit 4L [Docophoroides brevis]